MTSSGERDSITLCNIGGQTCNITGWRVTDSDTAEGPSSQGLIFGEAPCAGNTTLIPTECIRLLPLETPNVTCGFEFAVSFRDEVNLFDESSRLVAKVSWQ